MAFMPRAMFAPGVGGLGGGIDGKRKLTMLCFGYVPDGAVEGALPCVHQGRGDVAIRCQESGEFFPASRIRRQWDDKLVGDIYLKQPPRYWPLR